MFFKRFRVRWGPKAYTSPNPFSFWVYILFLFWSLGSSWKVQFKVRQTEGSTSPLPTLPEPFSYFNSALFVCLFVRLLVCSLARAVVCLSVCWFVCFVCLLMFSQREAFYPCKNAVCGEHQQRVFCFLVLSCG